jgi:hypothetical protein
VKVRLPRPQDADRDPGPASTTSTRTRGARGEGSWILSLIPLDDAEVYKMISAGDVTGVFQLESSGFRELLKKLRPDCFEDIVAAGALYRPARSKAAWSTTSSSASTGASASSTTTRCSSRS